MKVRPEIVETVCYLGVEDENGVIRPRATAFYVVVPFRHARDQGRGYLVTARHNIEKLSGRLAYVSINEGLLGDDRTPTWVLVKAEKWFVDDDPTVDVAIADWGPERNDSYLGVLTDNFIEGTPENGALFELAQGMETATIGLFSHHAGTDCHTPIVRTGNIAALPLDKVMTMRGLAYSYLIESRSVGGLSGSPVFVGEDVFLGFKRQPLLGLIHGHFDWKEEASSSHWQTIHTGIAVVTPSSAITKILQREDCMATRIGYNCVF